MNLVTERTALRLARLVVANSERTQTRRDRARRRLRGAALPRCTMASTRRASRRRARKIASQRVGRSAGGRELPTWRSWGRSATGGKASMSSTTLGGSFALVRHGMALLVVVGTGAELPAWQARAVDDGVADRILFLGFRRTFRRSLSLATRWSRRHGTKRTAPEFTRRCAAACLRSFRRRPASPSGTPKPYASCSSRTLIAQGFCGQALALARTRASVAREGVADFAQQPSRA